MFRHLLFRLVAWIAVRALSGPCAFWFGSRVMVIVPGVRLFTITPDEARDLAEKLQAAVASHTKP